MRDVDDGDLLGAIEELRHVATELAGRLSAGASRTFTGADESGTVTIRVQVDGRVVGVALHEDWRRRIGEAGLAKAVAESIANATRAAAAGWATSVADAGTQHNVPGSVPNIEPPPPALTRNATIPISARELLGLLRDAEAQLADFQALAQQQASTEVCAAGPAGAIHVAAKGGVVVRIDCDRRWLATADDHRVERELAEALGKALPGVRHQMREAVRLAGPLGELVAHLDDPVDLLRRLGLPGG